MKNTKIRFFIYFFALLSYQIMSHACTGVLTKTKNDDFIFSRTLEFPVNLQSEIIVIPKGRNYTSRLTDTLNGISWQSKYDIYAINAFDLTLALEGLNEEGLFVSGFYFPKYAEYKKLKEAETEKSLSPWDFVSWALGNFSNLEQLTEGLNNITLVDSEIKKLQKLPPTFHFLAFDKTGRMIAIEPIGKTLKVIENPVGVFTNAPTLDWHLNNLNNYLTMTPFNPKDKTVNGRNFASFGVGAGMFGLPGDFTPPSRFVRTAMLAMMSLPAENNEDGVILGWNIINNINIPKGSVMETLNDKLVVSYSEWTVVWDINHKTIYFKTYENQNIKKIDFNKIKTNGKVLKCPMHEKAVYTDVTDQLN